MSQRALRWSRRWDALVVEHSVHEVVNGPVVHSIAHDIKASDNLLVPLKAVGGGVGSADHADVGRLDQVATGKAGTQRTRYPLGERSPNYHGLKGLFSVQRLLEPYLVAIADRLASPIAEFERFYPGRSCPAVHFLGVFSIRTHRASSSMPHLVRILCPIGINKCRDGKLHHWQHLKKSFYTSFGACRC